MYIKVKDDKSFSSENEIIEMNFESNLIIGSTKYKNYLLSILKELIDENKCFIDNFTGYDEFYSMDTNYDFVYCKNEEDIKNKLKI